MTYLIQIFQSSRRAPKSIWDVGFTTNSCITQGCLLENIWVFPDGSDDKEFPCSAGDLGVIPGSERSPVKGNGYPASILAWRIPWTEEPGRLQSLGRKESDTTKRLLLHLIHLFPIASFLYLLEGFICFSYSPSFLKQTLVSYPNEKRLEKRDLE